MRILILGSQGRQGLALQHAFEKLNVGLGFGSVGLIDERLVGHEQGYIEDTLGKHDWDLVVSCLPYDHNIFYGELCIKAGHRWADLGGHMQSSTFLNKLASERACVTATDLGLAPGLVEYLGFKLFDAAKLKPESIRIMCGGLPQSNKTAFGYQVVFSPEGLVNNYVDNCEALLSGNICQVDAMYGNDWINRDGITLETGNSSGGTTYDFLRQMRDLGVKNCQYQTLRYPGHWSMAIDAWERYSGAPTDAEAREDMANWIKRHATEEGPDVVYIGVDLNTNLAYTARIEPEDSFSAMQRATAFPTACASVLLAQGEFDKCNGPVNAVDIARSTKFWDMLKTILPEIE